jgi:hypothetical protein
MDKQDPLFEAPKTIPMQQVQQKPSAVVNQVDQDEQLKATFELLKAEANQPLAPPKLDDSYLSDEPSSSSIREEITEDIIEDVADESEPSLLLDSDLQTTDRSVTPNFSSRNEHDYSEPVDLLL